MPSSGRAIKVLPTKGSLPRQLPQERIRWDESKPDGVSRKVVDESKLRQLMPDYEPVLFEEGLKKTMQWYLANKDEADRRK